MNKNMHTLDTADIYCEISLGELMNLYKANYILLAAVQQCLSADELSLKNEHGYSLQIDKGRQSYYTADLVLRCSMQRRRQGREIIVPIVCFKVRLYLDTRQAAVLFTHRKIERVMPISQLSLSFQSKWYYNSCLKIILSRFFQLPVNQRC